MMRRRDFCRTTLAAAGALAFPGFRPGAAGSAPTSWTGSAFSSIRCAISLRSTWSGRCDSSARSATTRWSWRAWGSAPSPMSGPRSNKTHMSAPSAHVPAQRAARKPESGAGERQDSRGEVHRLPLDRRGVPHSRRVSPGGRDAEPGRQRRPARRTSGRLSQPGLRFRRRRTDSGATTSCWRRPIPRW